MFRYEYDFGDCWDHEVTVERRGRFTTGLKVAVCVDGANACPPEDCGGTGGYQELLAALSDPHHPDHVEMTRWVGRRLDPFAFDLIEANTALQRIR